MTSHAERLAKGLLAYRANLSACRSATRVCGGRVNEGCGMAYDVAIRGFDENIMPLLLLIREEGITTPPGSPTT